MNAKQLANATARFARKLGWKKSDIVVTHDDLAELHTVTVAGRELNLAHGPTLKKLAAGLGIKLVTKRGVLVARLPDESQFVFTKSTKPRHLVNDPDFLFFLKHFTRRNVREFRALA